MSKLLKFIKGGLSAVLEDSENERAPGFKEFSEWLRSISGTIVPLSIFLGFIWELGRMVATYVLTEGDVWFSVMLIVVNWSQIVTSSLSMAPIVVFLVLFMDAFLPWTKKEESTNVRLATIGFIICICLLIFGFAFLRFWNYGNVCAKDLPVKSMSPWNLHCGWYELAYPGESLSVLHWTQPIDAPGNLGAAIIVPTSNIVMQIGTTKSPPACWQWLRNVMIPAWMRFPPCKKPASGSWSTNSWSVSQKK